MKKTIILLVILIAITSLLFGSLYAYDKLTNPTGTTEDTTNNEKRTGTKTTSTFTVYDYSGNPCTPDDMLGKPLVVNFWATWCGPCTSELPGFNNLCNEYAGRVNFMMVNVEDGNDRTVKMVYDFVQDNNYTFPLYYDLYGEASRKYSIRSIPMTLFIDSNGKVVEQHVGSMDEQTVRAKIESLS